LSALMNLKNLKVYLTPRALSVLALGFASGLPWSLTHTTLGYWLSTEGVSMKAVGLFSLAALPYSLKFLWAPFMDLYRWPLSLGRRQGWMLWAQLGLALTLGVIALVNPQTELPALAYLTLIATFFAASQDIAVDGWRVETLPVDEQGVAASWATLGYRVGMYASSAGALLLSSYLPWRDVYLIMSALVGVGVSATLLSERVTRIEAQASAEMSAEVSATPRVTGAEGEPLPFFLGMGAFVLSLSPVLTLWVSRQSSSASLNALWASLSGLWGLIVHPVGLCALALGSLALTRPYHTQLKERAVGWVRGAREAWGVRWLQVLMFVALYRLGDHLLGLFLYPSLNDLGFSALEIAGVVKTWGLIATFLGTFLGGWLVYRWGLQRVMVIAGIAQLTSNLTLSAQSLMGHDVLFLYVSIGAQDLALGMVNATFVAYLSSLCDVRYAATHFALLSALSSLLKTFAQAGSGWIVDHLKAGWGVQRGWALYFAFTALVALPGLLLLLWLNRRSALSAPSAPSAITPPQGE
jgi:PAT family beta-lactamase induction signal transducer AmpG